MLIIKTGEKQSMSKFLYYCPNCNKLYMAGEAGKTVKCTGCSEIALDMGISSDEYNALNTAQKQELKNRIILKYSADESYENAVEEDTSNEDTAYDDTPDGNMPDEDFAHDASDGGIKEQETTVDKPGTEAAGSNDTEVKNDTEKAAAKTDDGTTVVLRRRRGIAGNSRAGRILIALSKIGLLLSLIGSAAIGFLVANEMYASVGIAYGLAAFLVCTLLCLIIMGIGEISILLASVNAKLDEK